MKKLNISLLSLLALVLSWAPAAAQGKPAPKSEAEIIAAQLPSYPLTVCPVSNNALDKDAKNVVVDGTLVRLCCDRCIAKVTKNESVFKSKVEEAVVAQQSRIYPTDKCLVSGEPLGSMGDPIMLVHGTRLVKLCCKGCLKGFNKNPSEHIANLDTMLIKSLRETYPLENCVISEEPLGSMGDPIEILHGVTLVRLCCKGCVKSFEKDPATHVATVIAADAKNAGLRKMKNIEKKKKSAEEAKQKKVEKLKKQ